MFLLPFINNIIRLRYFIFYFSFNLWHYPSYINPKSGVKLINNTILNRLSFLLRRPKYAKDKLTEKKLDEAKKLAKQATPDWLYQEVEEDLDGLADKLKKLGAIVHRPKNFDLNEIYSTPEWNSTSNNIYKWKLKLGYCRSLIFGISTGNITNKAYLWDRQSVFYGYDTYIKTLQIPRLKH